MCGNKIIITNDKKKLEIIFINFNNFIFYELKNCNLVWIKKLVTIQQISNKKELKHNSSLNLNIDINMIIQDYINTTW